MLKKIEGGVDVGPYVVNHHCYWRGEIGKGEMVMEEVVGENGVRVCLFGGLVVDWSSSKSSSEFHENGSFFYNFDFSIIISKIIS